MTTEEMAEIQELGIEREAAQRDLEETLGAIEEKLSPVPAVRRFVQGQSPARALTGMAAAGVALGLISDERPGVQLTGVAAAALAAFLLLRAPR